MADEPSVANPYCIPDVQPGKASPAQRHAMIRVAAYFLAERRNFARGRELEDWLRAEKWVDAELAREARRA